MNIISHGMIEAHLIVVAVVTYLAICINLRLNPAPPSPRRPLFTCQLCHCPGLPRSADSKFYRPEKSGSPCDAPIYIHGRTVHRTVYSRSHLLTVREWLAGRLGGPHGCGGTGRVPEAIRRNLPVRLSHLIRRKRGRRAGSHSHRPISVVCGTRAAGGRLDTVSRDPTVNADARAR